MKNSWYIMLFVLAPFFVKGQSDSSYFNNEHHLHFKELKPLVNLNISPVALTYTSTHDLYLTAKTSFEISDLKSILSVDGNFEFGYARLKMSNPRTYDFGYNTFNDNHIFNGGIGLGFTFKKEAVPAIKKSSIDTNNFSIVKLRRYDARLGIKYQERNTPVPIDIFNPIDSLTYNYNANLKDRNLLLSVGVKARVTRRVTPIDQLKGKTKNRESYFYLDLLFPVYFISHEVDKYNNSALDLDNTLSEYHLDEGNIIPAGVRLGFQYAIRQKNSFYIRSEFGLYPGRSKLVQNALGAQLTFGYSFSKLL